MWPVLAKWGIPIALSLFGAYQGSKGNKAANRVAGSQEDLLDLYKQIQENRFRVTGPYEDENGNMAGPMVDALMMALNNARQQSMQQPRSVVNAAPFNPFGEARPPQRFSSPPSPDLGALMAFLGQKRG